MAPPAERPPTNTRRGSGGVGARAARAGEGGAPPRGPGGVLRRLGAGGRRRNAGQEDQQEEGGPLQPTPARSRRSPPVWRSLVRRTTHHATKPATAATEISSA